MDTRTKIVSLSEALDTADRDGLTWVVGYFDPLTAGHADHLTSIGSNLAVLVLDPPDALLPLRARLELVAALRPVRVVVGIDDPESLEAFPADPIALQEQDLQRRDALIAHIQAKYALAKKD